MRKINNALAFITFEELGGRMPIRYRIDFKDKIIYSEGYGVVTDRDILDLKEKLFGDPEIGDGFREISDMRGVTDFNVTTDGIRKMVSADSMYAKKLKNYKLAIVADKAVIYGMGRMYEMRTERNIKSVKIFTDYHEAEKWIK